MKLPYDNKDIPVNDREPVPAGRYTAQITAPTIKTNKQNTGEYIAVPFHIVDGKYAKHVVVENYNLTHRTSPDAERIGRQQFKSLCVAAGVPNLQDTDELAGRLVNITVALDGSYNDVTLVEPAAQVSPPPTTAEKPAGQRAPWDS